jgi:hypothetical protein
MVSGALARYKAEWLGGPGSGGVGGVECCGRRRLGGRPVG